LPSVALLAKEGAPSSCPLRPCVEGQGSVSLTGRPFTLHTRRSGIVNCHEPCHALSREMSRVKSQKSLGKSDVVTVSRVKTPGKGVATEVGAVSSPRLRVGPLWIGPLLQSAVIRAYPRLFAV
jgi:hypothetical protein